MDSTSRKYSKEHEWISIGDGDAHSVGITNYAQTELGDVVFVALPQVGAEVVQFRQMGEIESVKAVSDLFSPVSGVVADVNEALVDQPELVNKDPLGEGWLLKVRLSDVNQLDVLMTEDKYEKMIEGLH
jgi:glycine cleavage system H protein